MVNGDFLCRLIGWLARGRIRLVDDDADNVFPVNELRTRALQRSPDSQIESRFRAGVPVFKVVDGFARHFRVLPQPSLGDIQEGSCRLAYAACKLAIMRHWEKAGRRQWRRLPVAEMEDSDTAAVIPIVGTRILINILRERSREASPFLNDL